MSASLALGRNEEADLDASGLLAPAKINLAIHVTGRRSDGYHTLSSLVAFAEAGDQLSLRRASLDAVETVGPFAAALAANLPAGTRNILARTLELARGIARLHDIDLPPLAVTLEKNLPIASGIGGGSADAAALLRHLGRRCPALAKPLAEAALEIGADLPMCVAGRPARISGIGEGVEPLAAFPTVAAVLVNPGIPVATPLVFRNLASRTNPPMPDLSPLVDTKALITFLQATRNDLEEPAISLAPSIGEARRALREAGALFARMSGSGATVFGLFESDAAAKGAAAAIGAAEPRWWTIATRLGDGTAS